MKAILTVAALALFALPAVAQPGRSVSSCTPSLVSANVCRAPENSWLAFDVTPGALPDLLGWADSAGGYLATVPCAATRTVVRGVLIAAGADAGDCTAQQIGESVPNPQSIERFTYLFLRAYIRASVADWKRQKDIESLPPPTTPDVGG